MNDVPRILLRDKAQLARRLGMTLQDRVLGEPQFLGRATAGPMARVANFVNANRLVRKAAQQVAGIAADFPVPTFGEVSFEKWLDRHTPLPGAGARGTVALFATCLPDYNFPHIAASAVCVVEKNGWAAARPQQTCYGLAHPERGAIAPAQATAKPNAATLL